MDMFGIKFECPYCDNITEQLEFESDAPPPSLSTTIMCHDCEQEASLEDWLCLYKIQPHEATQ